MKELMFKFSLFVLFVFLLGGNVLSAVDAPELRCVSVDSVGDVTLTWVSPADPSNEFLSYNVFVSPNKTGPFTSTVVNGIATNSFVDNINDASLNSYFYYLETVYDDGFGPMSSVSSVIGETILPIFGIVTDSTAIVNWNPVFDPNIVSNSGVYSIFRRIGTVGSFTNIGTANYGNENISDVFKVCSEIIFYRIETIDGSGCVSKSAFLQGEFEDETSPATPIYDSITVDNSSQKVVMGWKPSSSQDTEGYIILYYTKATAAYGIRDTVLGINSTVYLENSPLIDPTLNWEQYTLFAFDSCGYPLKNSSPGADFQKTMHLTFVPNTCDNTVTLTWTAYWNWLDLDGYEVLVSVNGSPYQLAATIAATDTTFTHQKTDDLAIYCYKISAVNVTRTKTSSSNRQCATANSLIIPAKQYFKKVTVENNQDIQIESLTDSNLAVSNYVLFRSLERFEYFFEVGRTPFDNSSIIKMNDVNANVDQTSYYYRIGVEDTCGSLLFISRPASSIFLKGVMDEDSLNVSLTWNEYFGWDTVFSGVEEYAINLIIDGQKMQVGTVPSGITNFIVPMLDKITLGANFCFQIEAREGDGNRFGQKDTVVSNQVCFTDNLKVFVPNAFRPGGENPVFYPVFSFGDISSYHMYIYDRWGQLIYETIDINQGWDGMVNDGLAEFGVYVYRLEVANFTGAHYKKSGTFVLLR
ncbi:MAG: gliding motility-associated-like protein [Salibacteraceae bacterium]|jgi:gliding motility-associated-like protein